MNNLFDLYNKLDETKHSSTLLKIFKRIYIETLLLNLIFYIILSHENYFYEFINVKFLFNKYF